MSVTVVHLRRKIPLRAIFAILMNLKPGVLVVSTM